MKYAEKYGVWALSNILDGKGPQSPIFSAMRHISERSFRSVCVRKAMGKSGRLTSPRSASVNLTVCSLIFMKMEHIMNDMLH